MNLQKFISLSGLFGIACAFGGLMGTAIPFPAYVQIALACGVLIAVVVMIVGVAVVIIKD